MPLNTPLSVKIKRVAYIAIHVKKEGGQLMSDNPNNAAHPEAIVVETRKATKREQEAATILQSLNDAINRGTPYVTISVAALTRIRDYVASTLPRTITLSERHAKMIHHALYYATDELDQFQFIDLFDDDDVRDALSAHSVGVITRLSVPALCIRVRPE